MDFSPTPLYTEIFYPDTASWLNITDVINCGKERNDYDFANLLQFGKEYLGSLGF